MMKLNQLVIIGAMCASVLFVKTSEARADYYDDWYWCDPDKIVPSEDVPKQMRLRHDRILDGGEYSGNDFCTENSPLDRIVNANILYNHLTRGDDPKAIRDSSSLGKVVYDEWVHNGKPVYKTSP